MRAKTVINENIEKKKNTLAIDFDGVIHSYTSKWTGDEPKDPPMPGVSAALEALVNKGWRLVILSTRKPEFIRPYLEKYGLSEYISDITNIKIPAKIYIDDRGYQFKNWSDTIAHVENFKDHYEN